MALICIKFLLRMRAFIYGLTVLRMNSDCSCFWLLFLCFFFVFKCWTRRYEDLFKKKRTASRCLRYSKDFSATNQFSSWKYDFRPKPAMGADPSEILQSLPGRLQTFSQSLKNDTSMAWLILAQQISKVFTNQKILKIRKLLPCNNPPSFADWKCIEQILFFFSLGYNFSCIPSPISVCSLTCKSLTRLQKFQDRKSIHSSHKNIQALVEKKSKQLF